MWNNSGQGTISPIIELLKMLRHKIARPGLLVFMALTLFSSAVASGLCAALCQAGLCPTCMAQTHKLEPRLVRAEKPMSCCAHKEPKSTTSLSNPAGDHGCCKVASSAPSANSSEKSWLSKVSVPVFCLAVQPLRLPVLKCTKPIVFQCQGLSPPLERARVPDLGRAPPAA